MELTLNEFVVAVLGGACALVLVFSLISRGVRRGSEVRSSARRVVCRLCLHAFEAADKGVVDCPHCGAANETGRGVHPG